MKRVTGLIVLTLLLGCGKREHPLAAGSIAAPAIRFEQAIYFLPSAPPNTSAVVDQLLASKYKGLRRVVATPNDVRKRTVAVRLEHDVQHKYTPPDLNALKYFGNGLTAGQDQSLQQSRDALVLQFAHPRSDVWIGLHDATGLMLDVARATGGLIWDG